MEPDYLTRIYNQLAMIYEHITKYPLTTQNLSEDIKLATKAYGESIENKLTHINNQSVKSDSTIRNSLEDINRRQELSLKAYSENMENKLTQIENKLIENASRIQNSLEDIRYRQELLLKVYQDTRIFNTRQAAFAFYKSLASDVDSYPFKINVCLAATTEIPLGDETIIQQSIDIYLLDININNNFSQEYLKNVDIIIGRLNAVSPQAGNYHNKNNSQNVKKQDNPLSQMIKSESFGKLFPIGAFVVIILVVVGLVWAGYIKPSQNSPIPSNNSGR